MNTITLLLTFALHTVTPSHPCHLTGQWSTVLTVDYARTDIWGAYVVASTADRCVCLVRVPGALLRAEPDVLSGREFFAAGRVGDGEIVLEKVCLTKAECQ